MDLSTTYMGLRLRHPIVASSSPLSRTVDGVRRLEDAGAAAVVLPSLFEEELDHESRELDHYLRYGAESYAEAATYFPEPATFAVGPDEYLELIWRAREAVDVPIIASLNGTSPGGWIEHARLIEQAGAAALELNVYFLPTDPLQTSAQVEGRYLEILRCVKGSVSIPVAMKMSPFFSATASMARQLADERADALVLFNRFYQPDFDLEALEVVPHLALSTSDELRLPLRWVAILYGRVDVDFAISSGVHTHQDVLKAMMAGARVAMMASALLRRGPSHIGDVLADVRRWMDEHEYESIVQMQGSMSQMHAADPAAFARANYMKTLRSWRPDPTAILNAPLIVPLD